jgi:heme-degrading monooxygenase HmoA
MLRRDLDEGLTEYVTLSLWESIDAVRAFAGDDPERAVFYPEDDAFLVERDMRVRHYQVVHEAHLAA